MYCYYAAGSVECISVCWSLAADAKETLQLISDRHTKEAANSREEEKLLFIRIHLEFQKAVLRLEVLPEKEKSILRINS